MMKHSFSTLLLLSAFALVCSISFSFAQSASTAVKPESIGLESTRPEPEIAHLGFGVSIIPYTFPSNDTYNLQPAGVLSWYVPVQVGKYFRVETEFGISSTQDKFPVKIDSTQSTENVRNNLFFRFGVGTYYTHPIEQNMRVYGGVRSGLVSSSVEWFSTPPRQTFSYIYNESVASFWFGGVFGFEYILTKNITIGAELHGTSYTTGQPHTSSPIPSNYPRRFNPDFSSDAFVSSANVALRFFF